MITLKTFRGHGNAHILLLEGNGVWLAIITAYFKTSVCNPFLHGPLKLSFIQCLIYVGHSFSGMNYQVLVASIF